jgi:hypothetical protein
MNTARGSSAVKRPTTVELFLPLGRRLTLTIRGKGLELLKPVTA